MKALIKKISLCDVCSQHLPHAPRPVFSVSRHSKILIIGQAPGTKAHESGIPWNDKSGDTLRQWLNVSREQFYDPLLFGIMPMGFCYPGRGASGDLPPRPECAGLWHQKMLLPMKALKLTLLIGSYAQKYYLQDQVQPTLTETVRHYRDYMPAYFPLVHPSPRNNIWQKKNSWFTEEVVPALQEAVKPYL